MRRASSLTALTGAVLLLLAAGGCGDNADKAADSGSMANRDQTAAMGPPRDAPASRMSEGDTAASPPGPAASSSDYDKQPFKGGGKTVTTASGLKYEEMKVGTGPAPKAGQFVSVHYTGTLKDGTVFDSSRERGKPIEFPLGQGQVIPGWDEGILSMKQGGRRKLMIPSKLGYGAEGTPGGPIPPNAELTFDVELVGVSDTPTQGGGM